MAEVKWIKIVTDIFDDEKIVLIEGMPEADSIIVIWFKLLCLAGKQNNGGIFMLNDKIPYTEEMLAILFRRPLKTIRLAIQVFIAYGMIEVIDNVMTIPKWEKHQSLNSFERQKEQTRKRVAALRERKKHQDDADVTQCNVTCNADVTQCNTDVTHIDKDIDKEEDIESNYVSKDTLSGKPDETDTKCIQDISKMDTKDTYSSERKEIIDYLNSVLGTHYTYSSKANNGHINSRLREGHTVEEFKRVIDKKAKAWKEDPHMCQYLRPETLFGSKFEGYLNELDKPVTYEQAANGTFDYDEWNRTHDAFGNRIDGGVDEW